MSESPKAKAFAKELQALLKKHDVALYACGCCDGIRLHAGDEYGQLLATWVEASGSGFAESGYDEEGERCKVVSAL